jgi:hypothetical protein
MGHSSYHGCLGERSRSLTEASDRFPRFDVVASTARSNAASGAIPIAATPGDCDRDAIGDTVLGAGEWRRRRSVTVQCTRRHRPGRHRYPVQFRQIPILAGVPRVIERGKVVAFIAQSATWALAIPA